MVKFSYGSGAVALMPGLKPKKIAGLLDDARKRVNGGVVVSINTQNLPSADIIAGAAEAVGSSSDVELYLLGRAPDLNDVDLSPLGKMQHLNCNLAGATGHDFLVGFTDLRTLMVQGSGGHIDLGFLVGTAGLTRLSLSGAVRGYEHLASCRALTYLSCASDGRAVSALSGHPALRYLDLSFGMNRDLAGIPAIPLLEGLALYNVRGLDSADLTPLGESASLTALSLGALRNLTHLKALRGLPSASLRALLLEKVPNLADLTDIAACSAVVHLGLYEARPKDKRLLPLRQLAELTHLVLGDTYPKAEVDALLAWYDGSIHYRDKVERGEFLPRWRTPIEQLAKEAA